jgi:hypothetical protein
MYFFHSPGGNLSYTEGLHGSMSRAFHHRLRQLCASCRPTPAHTSMSLLSRWLQRVPCPCFFGKGPYRHRLSKATHTGSYVDLPGMQCARSRHVPGSFNTYNDVI